MTIQQKTGALLLALSALSFPERKLVADELTAPAMKDLVELDAEKFAVRRAAEIRMLNKNSFSEREVQEVLDALTKHDLQVRSSVESILCRIPEERLKPIFKNVIENAAQFEDLEREIQAPLVRVTHRYLQKEFQKLWGQSSQSKLFYELSVNDMPVRYGPPDEIIAARILTNPELSEIKRGYEILSNQKIAVQKFTERFDEFRPEINLEYNYGLTDSSTKPTAFFRIYARSLMFDSKGEIEKMEGLFEKISTYHQELTKKGGSSIEARNKMLDRLRGVQTVLEFERADPRESEYIAKQFEYFGNNLKQACNELFKHAGSNTKTAEEYFAKIYCIDVFTSNTVPEYFQVNSLEKFINEAKDAYNKCDELRFTFLVEYIVVTAEYSGISPENPLVSKATENVLQSLKSDSEVLQERARILYKLCLELDQLRIQENSPLFPPIKVRELLEQPNDLAHMKEFKNLDYYLSVLTLLRQLDLKNSAAAKRLISHAYQHSHESFEATRTKEFLEYLSDDENLDIASPDEDLYRVARERMIDEFLNDENYIIPEVLEENVGGGIF